MNGDPDLPPPPAGFETLSIRRGTPLGDLYFGTVDGLALALDAGITPETALTVIANAIGGLVGSAASKSHDPKAFRERYLDVIIDTLLTIAPMQTEAAHLRDSRKATKQ